MTEFSDGDSVVELRKANPTSRIKGRPHYYSTKKEEYARIQFDLDAGM